MKERIVIIIYKEIVICLPLISTRNKYKNIYYFIK